MAGFEPATPASRTQCSTRLSHTPTWRAAYRHAPAVSQAPKIPPQKEKRREKRSSKQRCIRPTPALSPPPRRAPRGFAVPAGEWCNGNTAVFGTVVLGSSPSSPATSSSRSKASAPAVPWAGRWTPTLNRGFPQKLARASHVWDAGAGRRRRSLGRARRGVKLSRRFNAEVGPRNPRRHL